MSPRIKPRIRVITDYTLLASNERKREINLTKIEITCQEE